MSFQYPDASGDDVREGGSVPWGKRDSRCDRQHDMVQQQSGGCCSDGKRSRHGRRPGQTVIHAEYGGRTASFPLTVLPSDNASLSGIEIDGAPLDGFNPGLFTYSVTTPNRQTTVRLSAQLSDPGAALTFNGSPAASGEVFDPAALAEGPNVFRFTVTAEDGTTSRTYTIVMNRSVLPTAPQNLRVRTDHSQALLSWSASPEADVIGYNVYLGETRLTELPSTDRTFLITGLHNGKHYEFSVMAVNRFGEESATSSVTEKVLPDQRQKRIKANGRTERCSCPAVFLG